MRLRWLEPDQREFARDPAPLQREHDPTLPPLVIFAFPIAPILISPAPYCPSGIVPSSPPNPIAWSTSPHYNNSVMRASESVHALLGTGVARADGLPAQRPAGFEQSGPKRPAEAVSAGARKAGERPPSVPRSLTGFFAPNKEHREKTGLGIRPGCEYPVESR